MTVSLPVVGVTSPGRVPRRFAFVDSLPRTPTGKLAKHRLMKNSPNGLEPGACFAVRTAR